LSYPSISQNSVLDSKKGKGDMCDKATKGTLTKGASVPYKERSIGKKVKKNRGGRGSTCG